MVIAVTKSPGELAYFRIFDANDQKERAKLIGHILTDPKSTVLFLLNCAKNENEIAMAFDIVSYSPEHCKELLKKKPILLSARQREKAIEAVNQNTAIAREVAWECKLLQHERALIYQKHCSSFLKSKTLDNYWEQWNIFGDVFPTEELQLLVDMIYESESFETKTMAEMLLNYGKLTPDQRDKLESKTVVNVLLK